MPYVPPGGPVERGYTTPEHNQFTVIFLYSHKYTGHQALIHASKLSLEMVLLYWFSCILLYTITYKGNDNLNYIFDSADR